MRQITIQAKQYTEHDLLCPDCGTVMILVPFGNRDSSTQKVIYQCARKGVTNCSGCHGAHPSGAPLGTPAPYLVRQERKKLHEAFDQLWRPLSPHTAPLMPRRAAYRWLRGAMSLTDEAAHISQFTAEQCDQALNYVFEDFGFLPTVPLTLAPIGFTEITM